MAARRRELERAPRALLAADVGQVEAPAAAAAPVRRAGLRRLALAAQVRDRLGEVANGHGLDPGERRLGRRLGGAEEPCRDRRGAPLGRRERAADRPEPAVERELADRGVLREASGRKLARRREHRQRDRQVEARALLAQRGRREVDGDPRRSPATRSSAEMIPLRTRSFASWQARSPRPTIAKPGTPPWRCASTSTRRGSSPTRACVTVRASTCSTLARKASRLLHETVPKA